MPLVERCRGGGRAFPWRGGISGSRTRLCWFDYAGTNIGYNFLVDKFGRIWVGRYGGPRRAVIGAHTYGYNHLSTGAVAIDNFETQRPTLAMKRAFGRLLGWKLGLHGVRAGDRDVRMEAKRFCATNGHRDAGQTACPGIKLYRRLDEIRRIALRRQQM